MHAIASSMRLRPLLRQPPRLRVQRDGIELRLGPFSGVARWGGHSGLARHPCACDRDRLRSLPLVGCSSVAGGEDDSMSLSWKSVSQSTHGIVSSLRRRLSERARPWAGLLRALRSGPLQLLAIDNVGRLVAVIAACFAFQKNVLARAGFFLAPGGWNRRDSGTTVRPPCKPTPNSGPCLDSVANSYIGKVNASTRRNQ